MKKHTRKSELDLQVGNDFLPLNPKRLISLLDIMRLIHAEPLALLMMFIERCEHETDWRKGIVLSKKHSKFLLEDFRRYAPIWKDEGWDSFHYRLHEVIQLLEWGNDVGASKPRLPQAKLTQLVNKALQELSTALSATLEEYQWVMIDKTKRRFAEEDDLFGKSVSEVFPSAKEDIKAAGNCMAVELNTAAVFHLMRVVEFGLRALALHLKVKNVKKYVPIEFAVWDEIIVAMEKKTDALGKITRSKKRHADLVFYNELLNEARSMKDLWRNPVSHARRTFSGKDAEAIFGHVDNFMQRLAARVSETN